jgi:5-oxopent-3-ene-1,2,5-tricarboxylate decarboxylase/2-hydroxyhepta-2,4-diene-1,7-dioate isomerase
MSGLVWDAGETQRLAAIRDDLAQVSTASAFQMLMQQGWRNTYMLGLANLQPLGLGKRLVGRARTCRYLMRRGAERLPATEAEREANRTRRHNSAEIVTIESLEPGDIFCVDALGVPTSGIIGDILSARIKARGALAAVINGAVRDTPYIKDVGLPVFCAAAHPSASGRDVMPVDHDLPVNMAGATVYPGDIILADDEGVLAMPLDLAEYIAAHGPAKEHLEMWIRGKIAAGGSVHDYYPPLPDKEADYERETGRKVER